MKKIKASYTVSFFNKSDKFITTEVSITLEVTDRIANNLLRSGKSGLANQAIEKMIQATEDLKCRSYHKNSIKNFRIA